MIDEHGKIEMLLPWFVTGHLDAIETANVDAHVSACAECQLLLQQEYRLKNEVASMPVSLPVFGMSANLISHRPMTASHARQSTRQTVSRWSARTVRVAAFAAAQAAMLLIVFQIAQPATVPGNEFRTLSSGDVATNANAIIIFDADTREADFRTILMDANAIIVGGPTESNAYYLQIDPTTRDSTLESLRINSQILLAQPIDGE